MANELISKLCALRDDRAALSALRAWFSPARQSQAWPFMGRLGVLGSSEDSGAGEFIAAAFGFHPLLTEDGSFASVCRNLKTEHSTVEKRFQRVLSSRRGELPKAIFPLLQMARAKKVPIPYGKLYEDVKFWGPRKHREWAADFWKE